MSEIRWELLQPVDTGALVRQGFQTGAGIVKQIQTAHALRAYSANPDDPQALGALAMFNPDMAEKLSTVRRQQQQDALLRQKYQREAAELAAKQRISASLASGDRQGARTAALGSGDLETARYIDGLSKEEREAAAGRYKAAAPFAYQIAKISDPAARKQALLQAAPQLEAAGWSREQIEGFDPSDTNLGAIITTATTLEQLRERDEITYREVGPGARLVPFRNGLPITGDSGGAPSAAASTAAPTEKVGAVSSVLSSGGLPAPVIAGFLGNFDVEGGYDGAQGDGGSAAGIAQWRGERQTNFHRIIGKPVSQATPDEQARFVLWEMQNPEAAGMTIAKRDAILAARTPEEAAELIDRHYERSDGRHRSRRAAAARRYGTTAAPGNDPASLQAYAQQAIAAGADPAAVQARMAQMGAGQ